MATGDFLSDLADDVANTLIDTELGFAIFATTSGAAQVAGIFSHDYLALSPAAGPDVMSQVPVFRMAATAATGLDTGNTLTIAGTGYVIVEPQPLTDGVIDFRLRLA